MSFTNFKPSQRGSDSFQLQSQYRNREPRSPSVPQSELERLRREPNPDWKKLMVGDRVRSLIEPKLVGKIAKLHPTNPTLWLEGSNTSYSASSFAKITKKT